MCENDYQFYGEYAPFLENLQESLLLKISSLTEKVRASTGFSPDEHIKSRIKSADSISSKLKKRGLNPDVETAFNELSDFIGIRIITHFVGDVFRLSEQIQSSGLWETIMIKDYISSPKPNGYRSLHIIISVPSGIEKFPFLRCEIQLRTIAMDSWASLEHQMKYKKNIANAELISKELRRCANEIASTDLTMQTIKDMIFNERTDENEDSIR